MFIINVLIGGKATYGPSTEKYLSIERFLVSMINEQTSISELDGA